MSISNVCWYNYYCFILHCVNSDFVLVLSDIYSQKQSHYGPEQALRVQGGWGSQISRQSAHEGRKVASPTHRPSLRPRSYSWYSFMLETENPRAMVRPEGLCQWKIRMTPSGIEPTTFRLVAQCLNQLSQQDINSKAHKISGCNS